jgi:hypothetical protein
MVHTRCKCGGNAVEMQKIVLGDDNARPHEKSRSGERL